MIADQLQKGNSVLPLKLKLVICVHIFGNPELEIRKIALGNSQWVTCLLTLPPKNLTFLLAFTCYLILIMITSSI